MDPIRPVSRHEDKVAAVNRAAGSRVRRETPDEAQERREREQRERRRQHARRAWADSQLRALEGHHEDVIVSQDDSDDGRPHVDVRV